jgi:hypothetical protein
MKHTHKKILGSSNSPMTKLKLLWRTMPDDELERWRGLFVSNLPSAEIREKIRAELAVVLTDDGQLCRFRDWDEREQEEEEKAERLEENVRYWEQQFGTQEDAMEKARKKLLVCSYAQAFQDGNFRDGLRTLRADCRERRLELAAQNSAETQKQGQARALELCLEDAKKHPEVVEMFQQAFTALEKAREEQV